MVRIPYRIDTAPDRGVVGMKADVKPRGIRQSMSDLHTWAGLLVGWILYAMFLTGTVSYDKDEISQWMRPEVAHQKVLPDAASAAERVAATLGTIAAGSSQWSFDLPNDRSSVMGSFWRTPGAAQGRARFRKRASILQPARK